VHGKQPGLSRSKQRLYNINILTGHLLKTNLDDGIKKIPHARQTRDITFGAGSGRHMGRPLQRQNKLRTKQPQFFLLSPVYYL
jgi:hypothetical protein